MSRGEKQRISIARTALKNGEIFLLNEFTSALDSYTERDIFKNLESLIGKKTILMVTHRLNYIEKADCVVVIKDGKVVASGTHQELLNVDSYYKNLYKYSC